MRGRGLRWWHRTHRTDCRPRMARRSSELASQAAEAVWEPLRRWMGQAYTGLRDLGTWERRHDGSTVQHTTYETHLESRRYASTQ